MKRSFRRFWYWYNDWRQGIWSRVFRRIYKIFAVFEAVKGVIAKFLYRQRGRFGRPFVHTAMGGMVALSATLAPVLASSFPGTSGTLGPRQETERSVMELDVMDAMSTQVSDRVRDSSIDYVVNNGDTLSAIADKYEVSMDTIRWENNLSSINSIRPGQHLKILPVTGVRHTVSRGETVYTIAKKYGTDPQAIVDFPFNTFADNESFALAVGQDLIIPDGEKPAEVQWSPRPVARQRTPDAGSVTGTGKLAWPIYGANMTQRFTGYHTGVDLATKIGTPVFAADSGTVISAGWNSGGYGNRVMIDHHNGLVTLYGHLSRIDVSVGQGVNRGVQIGLEGSTGRSTGPHLHFEVRAGGKFMNPLNYLK